MGHGKTYLISVVLPTPAHSHLPQILSYRHSESLIKGALVRAPLGKRELLGMVWACEPAIGDTLDDAIKPITWVLPLPVLAQPWCDLVEFTAKYYQRTLGEIAMTALPPQLRELDALQMTRKLTKFAKKLKTQDAVGDDSIRVALSSEQQLAFNQLSDGDVRPALLFGATGSGKTEVYLCRLEAILKADAQAQVLVMVPEINLTPQLESRFKARIEARFGLDSVVLMHSGLTPAQRVQSWLAAHMGQARVVLGTRLAVLASMPRLRLIVVDEEHDPSYKSQDGARYSARDLAVYRGNRESVQVILGSATPSIETWHNAQSNDGKLARYRRIDMPSRIDSTAMPEVRLIDLRVHKKKSLFGECLVPEIVDAIQARAARGEQSLLFLNRRGYAPVLTCSSCDWKSACPNCSAYQVFHKQERRLRCHHCALVTPVPRACPECGDVDIGMQGRGTEQLEEVLAGQLGKHLRVLRLDADSTKLKGSLEAQMALVHSGEVDVLVGTQMVTKGHDFRRISLVVAVNPDSALYAADFRAPERLFSLLMQAAGRAGRDVAVSVQAQVWLQTAHPEHALYQALKKHDYPAFANQQLTERTAANMPPTSYQALLRAEAKTQELAQAFLEQAALCMENAALTHGITLYPAVPMPMQRIAKVERAQMLVESPSRAALQQFLAAWQPYLRELKMGGVLRWALDVDPLTI
jgi:primosomal protein N' (replication factor Y) (superfamily II helicase)